MYTIDQSLLLERTDANHHCWASQQQQQQHQQHALRVFRPVCVSIITRMAQQFRSGRGGTSPTANSNMVKGTNDDNDNNNNNWNCRTQPQQVVDDADSVAAAAAAQNNSNNSLGSAHLTEEASAAAATTTATVLSAAWHDETTAAAAETTPDTNNIDDEEEEEELFYHETGTTAETVVYNAHHDDDTGAHLRLLKAEAFQSSKISIASDEDDDGANNGDNHATLAQQQPQPQQPLLICDLGYGLPKEARPRKEKLLAISRQLVNFLYWQQQQQQQAAAKAAGSDNKPQRQAARVLIVLGSSSSSSNSDAKNYGTDGGKSCTASIRQALTARMHEVWNQQSETGSTAFPDATVSFTEDSLEVALQRLSAAATSGLLDSGGCDDGGGDDDDDKLVAATASLSLSLSSSVVYLSPDAESALDPLKHPPTTVIVGLLIDRRTIQVNRSVERAAHVAGVTAVARWPLECIDTLIMHKNEPLNVDCILEGMQQWYWNVPSPTAFEDAAIQAIRHHQERHPERPRHKDL